MIHAIDVSTAQGTIDHTELNASRYEAAWVKVSEGQTIDPRRIEYAADFCRQSDLLLSCYHFAQFSRPSWEAQCFSGSMRLALDSKRLNWRPCLDLEPKGTGNAWGILGLTRAQLAEWVGEFSHELQRFGWPAPIVYMPAGRSYVDVVRQHNPTLPVWMAIRPWRVKGRDYPPLEPELSGCDCAVVQYASRIGGVPGIVGDCDRNVILRPEEVRL